MQHQWGTAKCVAKANKCFEGGYSLMTSFSTFRLSTNHIVVTTTPPKEKRPSITGTLYQSM